MPDRLHRHGKTPEVHFYDGQDHIREVLPRMITMNTLSRSLNAIWQFDLGKVRNCATRYPTLLPADYRWQLQLENLPDLSPPASRVFETDASALKAPRGP
ncbi:hypothetical protein [Mesorhizobium sp. A623]